MVTNEDCMGTVTHPIVLLQQRTNDSLLLLHTLLCSSIYSPSLAMSRPSLPSASPLPRPKLNKCLLFSPTTCQNHMVLSTPACLPNVEMFSYDPLTLLFFPVQIHLAPTQN